MDIGDRMTLKVPHRLADGHPLEDLEDETHEVIVVALDRKIGQQPAAAVLLTRWTGVVMVELTVDQKRDLGLGEAEQYLIHGGVVDKDGAPVALPQTEEVTVPKRWLT